MQCEESRRILDAYVDNEIDLMQSVALEDHLAGCSECSQRLGNRRALKSAVQDASLRYTAPPELRQQVRRVLGYEPHNKTSALRHWFTLPAFRLATAMVVCAVLAAVTVIWLRGRDEQRLVTQVIDDHVRSMIVDNGGFVSVRSSNQHTVKPWFNGKISFSPKVADLADKGFPLQGGRLDYMNQQTVAALVYRRNQHIINVFEYPDSGVSRPKVDQERGFNVIYWTKDGMQYCVVSDLNMSELKEFAGLLRE
jgi:anti-sigma factor RsiW